VRIVAAKLELRVVVIGVASYGVSVSRNVCRTG
jgi:hypothetical protein